LSYGITEEDARDMKLPSTNDGNFLGPRARRTIRKLANADKETIRNLANANVMSPGDVAFLHEAQQQVREHLIDTAAGRKALRSAFGMTTAQLSAEYLDMVFRWVTRQKDNFNLGHRSAAVRDAMTDRWKKVMILTDEEQEHIAASSQTIRMKRRKILDSIAYVSRQTAMIPRSLVQSSRRMPPA
jgi:hypothetical protein